MAFPKKEGRIWSPISAKLVGESPSSAFIPSVLLHNSHIEPLTVSPAGPLFPRLKVSGFLLDSGPLILPFALEVASSASNQDALLSSVPGHPVSTGGPPRAVLALLSTRALSFLSLA